MPTGIRHTVLLLTGLALAVGVVLDAGGPATPTSIPDWRRTMPIVSTCLEACAQDIVSDTGRSPVVMHTALGLTARIDALGFSLETADPNIFTGDWSASLGLVHVGRPGHWSAPLPEATIVQWGDSVRIGHTGFDVEYINSAAGLRQNFIVHQRPVGTGPLRVELKPGGDLRCEHAGGDLFRFMDTTGVARMTYSDLHVWDADGDTLDAFASMEDGLVVLAVNDRNADYPITIDPITGSSWSAESNQTNAQLGASVSSAGDVNGDGYSDIIVGSSGWTNGQAGEGRVQLHYGSANGPSAGISWSYETDQIGAVLGFGNSVATAGDVNGDGYSDIIVGAPYFDNGETNEGRVFVFHGSATGLSAAPDWIAESNQANALFGYAVNCAGDVNGDGYSDVVIGAYQFDGGEFYEGRVFVYHGSATGLSAVANWTAESNQVNAIFGFSVASAGDVNGDGYSDVIVGAPRFDNGQTNEGRAFVYHGSAAGLSATANWTTESNQANSQTGFSVSSAGDRNNDGYSDVVVGIPYYASILANDGRAVVHNGSATGLGVTATEVFDSSVSQAQFGKSVACAGDVNGDGYSDLIIGSPEHNAAVATGGGAITVFYRGGPTLFQGGQASSAFGSAVSSAGDVNGDGISDVIVGMPLWDNGQTNEGRALVYRGSPASVFLASLTAAFYGPGGSEHYGQRLAGAGDVNGDGYSDVIIGDRKFGASDAGGVFLHQGSANGLLTVPGWSHLGTQASADYGFSVAGAGDVNGDGYSDVIVGAPQRSQFFANEGMAEVYLGSIAGLALTPSWVTYGGGAGYHYGWSVASAGDVNGDGYSDVIVGAPENPAAYQGRAHLYYGSMTGLPTTPSVILSSAFNGSFGQNVATAGDVNGDGYSDIIIGAGDGNRISVHHGGPGGISAVPSYTYWHHCGSCNFGSNDISGPSAITAGDVNGDGFSDVIVGARLYDNTLTDEGAAFCFLGGPSGLTGISWQPAGGIAGAWFGIAVGSAGDVDGDGYSDVVVGGCQATGGGMVKVFKGSPAGLGAVLFNMNLIGSSVEMGHSVAGVGDVNGDGYGDIAFSRYSEVTGRIDVLLGNYNGTPNGSTGAGVRNGLRLYNTDLVSPISASNIPDPQFGAGLYTHPFLGRVKNRIAWETRIQGLPFSSAGGRITFSTAFTAEEPSYAIGPLAGKEHKVLVDKLGGGTGITAHKVRARVRYDPVTAITGQVYGPWRYMPGYMNGQGTHNNVPLPVELLYFKATCDKGSTRLDWATASETNSSHFIIQRSSDATTWTDLGRVAAAGHSHRVTEYTFSDQRPATEGTTYYRALQFEQDGTRHELPLATSEPCSGGGGIRLFPNPTEGMLFVDLSAMKALGGTLVLLDASGRTRITARVEGTTQQLDLQGLAIGSYVLQILDEEGAVLGVEQVIRH